MEYDLNFFRKIALAQLHKRISTECTCDINLEKEELLTKTINNYYSEIHGEIINALISHYMEIRCNNYSKELFSQLFIGDNPTLDINIDDIDCDIIPILCEELHVDFLISYCKYKKGIISIEKSKKNLIEHGAVYTQEKIAYDIVVKTIENIKTNSPDNIKILDFAVGTGRFYKQILICLDQVFGIKPDYSILNNIYAVDIDPIAINVCRINALHHICDLDVYKAIVVSKHIIRKNALIKEDLFCDKIALCGKDLDGLSINGFDAIVSNPPYLVLKPNRKKMDKDTVDSINKMAKYFRTSQYYTYSIEGMLNLYQLSIEAMLGMLKNGGEMGVICPSTLFADVSTTTLRKFILSRNKVTYIKYFSEDDPLFDNVTQATCIFHLTKGEPTKQVEIEQDGRQYIISLENVSKIFKANWEIPSIECVEWEILNKLLAIPLLKDQTFIRNRRGELDLSLYKDFITTDPTNLRLVRGNMLSDDVINDVNNEYVKIEFFEKKSSEYMTYDMGRVRLVCQQISNQTQRVRLRFIECCKNDVLGNSCNYITVSEDLIPKMKAILNSALINWRFKITSTNNHINNYELDELPIIDLSLITTDILALNDIDRDKKICSLYGLDEKEINFIIKQYYEAI